MLTMNLPLTRYRHLADSIGFTCIHAHVLCRFGQKHWITLFLVNGYVTNLIKLQYDQGNYFVKPKLKLEIRDQKV